MAPPTPHLGLAFLLAAASLAPRATAQGAAGSDVRLRTYISPEVLYGDTGRTCYAAGEVVAVGAPAGCGHGCQWASSVANFSTAYEYLDPSNTFNMLSSSAQVVGAPDAYPAASTSQKAWAPLTANGDPAVGLEFIEFAVTTPVYVTGMTVYESNHPGAIVKVEGKGGEVGSGWYTLWEGAVDPPEGSSTFDSGTGQTTTSARATRVSPLAAPRGRMLQVFRLTLDTAAVSGYNEVDAIAVHGDGANGLPVDDLTPACPTASSDNCYLTCYDPDVLTEARADANLRAAASAAAFLKRALKVQSPGASLSFAAVPGTDASAPLCGPFRGGGVPVPQALLDGAQAELAVLVTSRPYRESAAGDPAGVTASVCRNGTTAQTLGRPLLIHLNIGVTLAEAAAAASADGERAVVDLVLHRLVAEMGFRHVAQTAALTTGANFDGTWADRLVRGLTGSSAVAKAGEHVSAQLTYVELEPSAGETLHERVWFGELMTAPAALAPRKRTAVSLAVLADTGWYTPDYTAAEFNPYGYKMGGDFASNKCTQWPINAQHYVCPTKSVTGQGLVFDESKQGAEGCNFDRTSKATCSFIMWPTPLPNALRVFESPSYANNGGPAAANDYCPLMEDSAGGDCTVASNGAGAPFYEEYSPASRCFTAERNAATGVGCFKHTCVGGKLWIKAHNDWLECPEFGGTVAFASSAVTVSCPMAALMCDVQGTPAVSSINPQPNDVIGMNKQWFVEPTNFQIGTDGTMQFVVKGHVVSEVTEDTSPGSFLKSGWIYGLPEGAYDLEIRLVSTAGVTVNSLKVPVQCVALRYQYPVGVVSASPSAAGYPPSNLLGVPDATGGYAEQGKTWAPAHEGKSEVVVNLTDPVFVSAVETVETFGAGALTQVFAVLPDGRREALWATGERQEVAPATSAVVISRATRAPSAAVRDVALVFSTPPWTEVDAVKITGYVELKVSLEPALGTKPYEAAVRRGDEVRAVLAFEKTGTQSLMWQLGDLSASPWIVPDALTGFSRANETTLHIGATLKADAASAGAQSASVQVFDIFGSTTVPLASQLVTLSLDLSVPVTPLVPPCLHGYIEGASSTSSGSCVCDPGASGVACDRLGCPNECGGPARGQCDVSTGVCVCAAGYSGTDCSGQDGDCYVSFDGTCRPGWEAGSAVVAGPAANNFNYATGAVPRKLQCEGLEDDQANEFGCSPFSHFEFCCRVAAPASCPFTPGAPACGEGACAGQWAVPPAELQGGCRAAVDAYCFSNGTDAGCHAYAPFAAPEGFCPLALAMHWCAGGAGRMASPQCANLTAMTPECHFKDASDASYPCVPQCAGELLFESAACRARVVAYCSQHAEEPECELHSAGDDGCVFSGASGPCTGEACASGLSSAQCVEDIREHCALVGVDGADEGCVKLGYAADSTYTPEGAVVAAGCPEEAAALACEETPSLALCRQLAHAGHALWAPASAAAPTSALTAAAAEAEAGAAEAAFAAARLEEQHARSAGVAAAAEAARLWARSDLNGDGSLAGREVERYAQLAGAQAALLGLPAAAPGALAAALAAAGDNGVLTRQQAGSALATALNYTLPLPPSPQ